MLHLIPNDIINPKHVNMATVYRFERHGHSGFMYLSICRSGGRSGDGNESGLSIPPLPEKPSAPSAPCFGSSNSSYWVFLKKEKH